MTDRAARVAEVERLRKIEEVERLRAAEAQAAAPVAKDTTTGGMSALRGAAQGASLGFGDELYGVVGAIANPTNSDKGFLERYVDSRDYARRKDAKAQEDNPGIYTGGAIAGGLTTAFAPGLGALNAGRGAKAAEVIGKGALSGGIVGAGTSTANPLSQTEQLVKDVGTGAAIGGIAGGAIHGAGKAAGAIKDAVRPSRAASVLLGAPEEAVELYMKNPAAVQGAKPRPDIVRDVMSTIDKLKKEVTEGSAASREILSQEGQVVSGSQLAAIFRDKADEILQRSEGVMDDPQVAAAYQWLRHMEKSYGPRQIVSPEMQTQLAKAINQTDGGESVPAVLMKLQGEGERNLSTNRVKDLVQNIQRNTDFQTAPGQFSRTDDTVRADVGKRVNELLKTTSPAYSEQMKGVAKDARLLDEASSLAGSPQAMEGLLKRVQNDRAFFPAEKLGELDARMGTQILKDLKLSAAKEAFEKGATNGSRNVNLYKAMAGGDGIMGKIGAISGAVVDKYGPKTGKALIDKTIEIRKVLDASPTAQTFGKWTGILRQAAQQGNRALAMTHLYLLQDKDYREAVNEDSDAVKRRIRRLGEK